MGNIYSFLNNPLQENLEPTPIIILINLFWSKNILFAIGWISPKNNTVPYL